MPQLLLELFSEEIPARMQAQAARDLERMARERLAEAGLLPTGLTAFAGPRRLTLVAEGLPPAQADRTDERKGPRVGAPDAAIDGFLRSTGLSRDQLTERDGVYFARIAKAGRPTAEIVAEMVEAIVRGFPWPKSMTWASGTLRWVRPLKRILCVFDGEVVPFSIDGIESGDHTEGHRFMGSSLPIRARTFDQYAKGLQAEFVVLEAEERKARILQGARTLCFARNLELVEDEALLDEVAGLAEWPTPILGHMDPAFLDLPPEVIRTSMRTHQKYFTVRDPATGALAPYFVLAANIEASDGGSAIAAGNARVLSARLNDARFFWDEDNKPGNFDRWLERLKGVTFHAKLGTMYERVERIEALAREIAPLVGADPELSARAARLCKADLASGMVGEFPELQGVMGGYYAREAGLPDQIADAVRDHYKPQGPSDTVPTASVTVAVALADKIDTLVSFFAADGVPTGSRDPYALRRATLGTIRLILENKLTIRLKSLAGVAYRRAERDFTSGEYLDCDELCDELVVFFSERLAAQLKEKGERHDLVKAVVMVDATVIAPGEIIYSQDDLLRIVLRVDALDRFVKTDDGANLLAGYKRAANILKAEAKKHPDEAESYADPVDQTLLVADEEKALAIALARVKPELVGRLQAEQFEAAMSALASLRGPVDDFFERVLVNSDVGKERRNRLRLLSEVERAMGQVADFAQITG